ncbi:MAG: hypothetical protein J7513_04630 [Solirubrobacteraceae bacterium]|nr:hypothetical protein [Solirubrobacteraceae bacterium]
MSLLAGLAIPSMANASLIAAASRDNTTIDVFQRDPTTGQLRQATHTLSTGRWGKWAVLAGDVIAPQSDVAVISRAATSLDVFYITTASQLRRRSWTSTGGWAAAVTVSTAAVNGGPSVAVAGADVFINSRSSANGTLVRQRWTPSTNAVLTAASSWVLAPWTTAAMRYYGSTFTLWGVGQRASTGAWNQLYRLPNAPTSLGALGAPAAFMGDVVVSGTPTVLYPGGGGAYYLVLGAPTGAPTMRFQLDGSTDGLTLWMSSAAGTPTTAPGMVVASNRAKWFLPGADTATIQWNFGPDAWTSTRPDESAEPASASLANFTPGQLRYFGRTDGDDAWKTWFKPADTPPANRTWMQSKTYRTHIFQGDGSPTTWYRGGMMYAQLYTIDLADAQCHPDWAMYDTNGGYLYAQDGETPHKLIAGNIFNPAYRAFQVNRIKSWLTASGTNFRGLWLDNVNLEVGDSGLTKQIQWNDHLRQDANGTWVGGWDWNAARVGALSGAAPGSTPPYVAPFVAPGTGTTLANGCTTKNGTTKPTDTDWSNAVAGMVEQLRAAIPGKELLVNTPWFQTQRNVENYNFITDVNGRPVGGLPTTAGRRVVDSSDFVNFESSFWVNAQFSGQAPPGTVGSSLLVGPSANHWSLDTIFRWIDGVHDRGKGIVAESKVEGQYSDVSDTPAVFAQDGPVAQRIREFNLAGHLITQAPRDAVGEYDRTSLNWPGVPGTQASALWESNVGVPYATPENVVAARPSDPTGRGVAMLGSNGNRLWVRAFERSDGQRVYVLMSEPSYYNGDGKSGVGSTVSYTVPTEEAPGGCKNMNTVPGGTQPAYAYVGSDGFTGYLKPRAALIMICKQF